MAYQDHGLLSSQTIVYDRIKLVLLCNVPSRPNDLSVVFFNATIICFKNRNSLFQGVKIGGAIIIPYVREQTHKMTQLYTVCVGSKVHLNFYSN